MFPSAGSSVQTLRYLAAPRTIARFDIDHLVRQAQRAGGVIVMACGVGDTLVSEYHCCYRFMGPKTALPESDLVRGIHFGFERTAEQDPKYPIRLLVDIAIKALSAAINDPTTAVQAIDQIDDPLRRLGAPPADAGYAHDAGWQFAASFSRCRHGRIIWCCHSMRFATTARESVQVMRRLRSALVGLADPAKDDTRTAAVERYLDATRFDCRKLNSHCGRPGNSAPGGPARPRPAAQNNRKLKKCLCPAGERLVHHFTNKEDGNALRRYWTTVRPAQ